MIKQLLIIPFGLCLAASRCQAAPAPTTKVLLAQNREASKIAQVASGALGIAHASWWGFDKADSTAALQDAINSKVPTLIVDNMGSGWIVGKTLRLVSNQKIIFNDGVVIAAKKGGFHGKNDALLGGSKLQNVTLEGQGHAVLRMNRADYANPKLYVHAEWRHGISLRDSSNITLRNLTITRTGGDGLYLGASHEGYNSDILVENVNFDENYRQEISIISAQNLTIRNCQFTNTKGTPPQDGIDFEPNHAGQRLVNCVVENSGIANNAGGGVGLYTVKMDKTTQPISITINNCQFTNNKYGAALTPSRNGENSVTGEMTFNNCPFDQDDILLQDVMDKSVHFTFNNCTLDFRGDKDAARPPVPILLSTDARAKNVVLGGATFNNITVLADQQIEPFKAALVGQTQIKNDISGDITLDIKGKKTTFDLASYLEDERAKMAELASLKPASINLKDLHAPVTGRARQDNNQFFARRRFVFLQYATKGQTITIDVATRKYDHRPTPLLLLDPSGKL